MKFHEMHHDISWRFLLQFLFYNYLNPSLVPMGFSAQPLFEDICGAFTFKNCCTIYNKMPMQSNYSTLKFHTFLLG